jgi:L-amino acid N-acyltransferase YncA
MWFRLRSRRVSVVQNSDPVVLEHRSQTDATVVRRASRRSSLRTATEGNRRTSSNKNAPQIRPLVERAAGIEPATLAWKARALPLCNARVAWRPLYPERPQNTYAPFREAVPATTDERFSNGMTSARFERSGRNLAGSAGFAAVSVRPASVNDLDAIRRIYNEGVEDRVATLERDAKSAEQIESWWREHGERYAVFVAIGAGEILGWASLNAFSARCAHSKIADLSVYVGRSSRGNGVGRTLLTQLLESAERSGFHKVVLHALDRNEAGKALYRRCGFVEVGVFKEHGLIDGEYVDVVAMEQLFSARASETNLGRAGFEPA